MAKDCAQNRPASHSSKPFYILQEQVLDGIGVNGSVLKHENTTPFKLTPFVKIIFLSQMSTLFDQF